MLNKTPNPNIIFSLTWNSPAPQSDFWKNQIEKLENWKIEKSKSKNQNRKILFGKYSEMKNQNRKSQKWKVADVEIYKITFTKL